MRKMLPKCQICDGPVVNGRCKYCGMPYRNDEVLYHLNENRRDHYAHATQKARQEMRKTQIPLYDGKKSASLDETKKKKEVKRNQERKEKERAAARAEIRARQEKVREEAMKRMEDGRASLQRRGELVKTAEKKKQGKNKSTLIAILCLMVIFLPRGMEWVEENLLSNLKSQDSILFEQELAEEGLDYLLSREDGELEAGGAILQEGRYQVLVREGYATLKVVYKGETERYALKEGEQQKIRLKKGAVISVGNTSSGSTCVEFYRL